MADVSLLMGELAVLEDLIRAKKERIENERAELAELLQRFEFKKALINKMSGAGDLLTTHLPNNSETNSSISE